MMDPSPQFPRLSPALAAMAAMIGVALISAIDWYTGNRLNVAILYTIPVLIAAPAMNRKLLWFVAMLAAGLGIVIFFWEEQERDPLLFRTLIVNRLLATGSVVVVAAVLHVLIGLYLRLAQSRELVQQRREELEQGNAELAARDEEITSQNEELQSQTEELERQSEELRVANEELARRERTLEVLLRLSRSLSPELAAQEVMDRVCHVLGELVDGPRIASGIVLREGELLRLSCHHGFGDAGPASTTTRYTHSFAKLVIERNSTGFLEDLSLRPDLVIPQPASAAKFQSILASPLRVNSEPIGVLEVYSHEKRSWTDEQVAMVESLASQTSVSLQTAELFKRIEQERRQLQAVLHTMPLSVLIANADLSDIRVNPAGAVTRGVPPDVNIASPSFQSRIKQYVNGELLGEDQHPLVRAVRYGETVHNKEIELVIDARRRYVMLYSAAPVRDRDGKILGGVAAAADITEQKKLQLELDARRREAEEASVRKTRFLAAVSHDIRTPANAISLLAELLQRTVHTPAMAGEVPAIASDLRSSALTLVNLVSDVLDLTRFDSGRIELEESEFPLESLLIEECRQLQPLAREKGLLFSCEPPAEPLTVRADRVKLSRILGNLLSNAIKFTEEGGVKVTAGASRQRGAWISVGDTGIGIPSEYQDRIFDEFFQLKSMDGRRRDGSGLGLAICRRLAEAMGGTITVQSTPGRGSTFLVTLPPNALVSATVKDGPIRQ